MKKGLLFALLTKVDEAKREVVGRAVQEVPDRADELFDYTSSKPYFEEWSKNFSDDTDGKSLGNLRAMHGKVAAGKLTGIDFNDTEKAIDIRAKVVDDGEWKKVLEGVYTGFSIGGSYVGDKRTEKLEGGREIKRYTAQPTEISLVDSPCVPTAKFFEVMKADGVVAKVAFRPREYEITGTDEEVGTFAKLLNDAGMTINDAIAAVTTEAVKRGGEQKKVPLAKSMYSVQELASCCSSLMWLCRAAMDEATREGDGSPLPDRLKACAAELCSCLVEMASEETREALAELGVKTDAMVELSAQVGALVKADDIDGAIAAAAIVDALQKRLADPKLPGAELLKIAGEHGETVDTEALKDIPALVARIVDKATKAAKLDTALLQKAHDHIAALGVTCGSKEAAAGTDLTKALTGGALTVPPAGDELAKLRAEVATANAELAVARKDIDMLKAQPVSRFVTTLRTVTKGQEREPDYGPIVIDPDSVPLTKDDHMFYPNGEINWELSRLLKVNRLEEQELARRRAIA